VKKIKHSRYLISKRFASAAEGRKIHHHGNTNNYKKTKKTLDVQPDEFKSIGAEMMKRSPPSLVASSIVFDQWWIVFFVIATEVAAIVWRKIRVDGGGPANELADGQPKHLLWALMFWELYLEDSVLAALAGLSTVDEKTYRKW
jgi:hypothetical protein